MHLISQDVNHPSLSPVSRIKEANSGITRDNIKRLVYRAKLNFLKNIPDSLVARITVCRMVDQGSIPCLGALFFGNFLWETSFNQLS